MKKNIYADNAATTKIDIEAFEAMKTYLLDDYSNASQAYSFSRNSKLAIKNARNIIARSINAKPEEIYFTSGGTESDNWAVKSVMLYEGQTKHMLTSSIEHHAILNSCVDIELLGHQVSYISVDDKGCIDFAEFENLIENDVKLVTIMLANNEIGTIQPIKALAKIAHANGALLHTDAVQAVGHISIDVQDLGVDMLSASAHKFNGPKGIGFLYVRQGTGLKPYMNGGSQEFGMRAGTENVASIVAMAIALKNNVANIETNGKHLFKLENALFDKLTDENIDFIVNGSTKKIPGNISLSFAGVEGEMLLHRLDLMGIYVSTGSACNSKDTEVSHVISAISVPSAYAKGTIRISFGHENTIDDAISIAEALVKIIKN